MSATDAPPATLRSWAEVDLAAIRRNLGALTAVAGPAVKIMAVVKANAYGHGAVEVVRALAGKVAMFGVANLREAEEIFAHAISADGQRAPIGLLSGTLPGEHAAVVRGGFIPLVSSFGEAAQYAAHASSGRVKIHLAVDTGMGRLGVWEQDAVETARRIMTLPGIAITGIGSHLPVADEDAAFTAAQLARFHALVAQLRDLPDGGLRDALVHVENSAGLLAFPNLAGALARPGLALYGESPLPEFQSKLSPALTWKTRVAVVRDFGKGRGVSYGRTFITPGPMRVATLAAGYADGYPRQVSGKNAAVLIGGKRCAILGRVTMDQIMADVTDVTEADAAPGAEAVLLGSQGGETIPVGEIASLAGTIAWDIFTGIGSRVARLHRDHDSGDASASKAPIPA